MREIKFRTWYAKDEEMLCDTGHYDIDGVVMQYTGLKDKNGVEIYELSEVDGLLVMFLDCEFVLCDISNGDIIKKERLYRYWSDNNGQVKVTQEYIEIPQNS